jgi:L-lactate permease
MRAHYAAGFAFLVGIAIAVAVFGMPAEMAVKAPAAAPTPRWSLLTKLLRRNK